MGTNNRSSIVRFATQYEDQSQDEAFIIPDDLTALSDAELNELQTQARTNFDQVYAGGADLSDSDFAALEALTDGIEAMTAELAARSSAAAERADRAAALAARVRGENTTDEADVEASVDEAAGSGSEADDSSDEVISSDADGSVEESNADAADSERELVTASARRTAIRVPMSTVRARAQRMASRDVDEAQAGASLVASADGLGHTIGGNVTVSDAAKMLSRRLSSFNATRFESAARQGMSISERHPLVSIRRNVPQELTLTSDSASEAEAVMSRAASEYRLPGGSLVAAGGWCAPSETVYDLFDDQSSRDGILSLPEIGVARGGLAFSPGPDFAALYALAATEGFSFTEDEAGEGHYKPGTATAWAADTNYAVGDHVAVGDAVLVAVEAGKSDETTAPTAPGVGGEVEDGTVVWRRVRRAPNVAGDKSCFDLPCPPFDEYRLDVDGLCITAGILQNRAFPEALQRAIQGAIVAHDHVINGRLIEEMAVGSTAVTMGNIGGATSSLLTAIELQAEHVRSRYRMARSASLEAAMPFWARGVIRSDLANRAGTAEFNISDAQIADWFAIRGIVPQFVYNWQSVDATAAGSFTGWPNVVSFLVYPAGTWIKGISDAITIDTLYDSQMLGSNSYTALFTEEGWFVAKRGHDSRLVTVSLGDAGAAYCCD